MLLAKDKRLVVVLSNPVQEAKVSMNGMQYCHSIDLVKRLVDFDKPHEMIDMPITTVGDFHQLRLAGGIFGSLDFRVIFKDREKANEIVILKTCNMEDCDEVDQLWLEHAEMRLDYYLEGGVTASTIVYRG